LALRMMNSCAERVTRMMLRLCCPLGEMIRRSRTGRRTARDQR
jgi:hypothetical protein